MTVELARAAQSGDDVAFAGLIEQHRAGMRAVAISLLGHVDEAEDAVQDAVLVALRRLPELRDPAVAGPWLRAIVRNNCRMALRARRAVPVAEPEPLLPADPGPGPDQLLDRAATRDWVHHAVAALPRPVREVTVLRYFSAHSSYRQIAELCAVPEHTVRSRLRDGRQALRRVLHETAAGAHADSAAAAAASRAHADATLDAAHSGHYHRMLRESFRPDARLTVLGGLTGTPEVMLMMLDYTLGAGVRTRLREATASRDVMVWETDFVNPADAPDHCPPGMVWLHSLRDGRTAHLRLAYRLEE
ncbi:RNA polymerase sigma factor [Symbioplanes lichenis]|uniref:RNA polymerase sigma factor n=1 Tax=Symbioplanes lichenis TaxID=1629072 RepID=UPI00273A0709|nr:sigma-70 family RNA polymerase sigma factor [Actinoplanes lichenis]